MGAKPTAASKAEAKAKPKPKAKEPKEKEERPEDLIPKVEPANEEEYQAKFESIQKAIDGFQAKKKELDGKVQERSGGKDEYHTQRLAMREELNVWSRQMDEVKAQKDSISGQMGEKKQEAIAAKDNLNKLKKAMPFGSEAEIDKRIATIEFKMHTESMPMKEEKKLLAEIQELKKNRPKVAQIQNLGEALKTNDTGLPLKEQMKELNEKMSMLYEGKKKVSEKLKELNEKRAETTGDLPDIIAKRDELQKGIGEKIKERNELRAEKKQKDNDYYHYTLEIRKIKQQRAAEDRAKRQGEYDERKKERAVEKVDEQPHVAEITLIEQTIAFCKTLTQTKGAKEAEVQKEIKHTNKAEEVVLLKKQDREDETFFVNPKAKNKKNKGQKAAEGNEGAGKPIKHNANTFQLFHSLKLDAPITTDDVPALLEKLEAQLVDYKDKVKEWEVNKDGMKATILAGEGSKDEETKGDEE